MAEVHMSHTIANVTSIFHAHIRFYILLKMALEQAEGVNYYFKVDCCNECYTKVI
jgi:hypothetical protein